MATIEERRFTRVPIRTWVNLTAEGGPTLLCDSSNLSMNGLLVKTSRELPVGTECFVTIILGDPANPLTLSARGQVVRQDGRDVGVHFTEIELDSFEHLRRLVTLNAKDVTIVEEELDAHVGLRPR